MKKFKVGILGATGMVGQNYIRLLDGHPWFEVASPAASSLPAFSSRLAALLLPDLLRYESSNLVRNFIQRRKRKGVAGQIWLLQLAQHANVHLPVRQGEISVEPPDFPFNFAHVSNRDLFRVCADVRRDKDQRFAQRPYPSGIADAGAVAEREFPVDFQIPCKIHILHHRSRQITLAALLQFSSDGSQRPVPLNRRNATMRPVRCSNAPPSRRSLSSRTKGNCTPHNANHSCKTLIRGVRLRCGRG